VEVFGRKRRREREAKGKEADMGGARLRCGPGSVMSRDSATETSAGALQARRPANDADTGGRDESRGNSR
jgi:hypothetical protein